MAMTHGGRPVERPAHLSQEQRQHAQMRTRLWREQARRTQAQMAAEIGVSYATYRPWENGRDTHAGPTRLQADQLDRALHRLLPGSYIEGEAFDAWGWPRQQDMSYDQVFELLRRADFDVPRPQPRSKPPTRVFWVHKVRSANLLHGVFALAAAACTRAGMSVHLLLDDASLAERDRWQCAELESRIRGWLAFASGNDAKLTTGLFSGVLGDQRLVGRAWPAINDYLNMHSSMLEVLLASKAISPVQYPIRERDSILELRNDSIKADRLLTAVRNWLVFEAEIGRLLDGPASNSDVILTLGGGDERMLWEVWQRGCSDDLAARVQHVFLRPMPIPPLESAWNNEALSPRTTHRTMLTNWVTDRIASDGDSGLLEWLLRAAVRLPADLNPGFRDGLDQPLRNVEALLRASPTELSALVGTVAKAVTEWLTSSATDAP
jgi:transcriptional regulator with XRE-family HTH domain